MEGLDVVYISMVSIVYVATLLTNFYIVLLTLRSLKSSVYQPISCSPTVSIKDEMSRRQPVSYEVEDLRRNVADLTKRNADLTNKNADLVDLARNDKSKELRDKLSAYEAQVGLHCTPMHACINVHMCVCACV